MLERPNPPSPEEGARGDAPHLAAFEPFTLDVQRHALFCASERIHLTAKPLHVLEYLVGHAGKTVSKRELLEAVWADLFVTEDVLVQAVGEIRRALGDDKGDPRFVQTIPREGYRFVARVSWAAHRVEGRSQSHEPGVPQVGQAGGIVPSSDATAVPGRQELGAQVRTDKTRTNRRLAAALAAMVALGAGLGGVWWWRARHAEVPWGRPLMIAEVAGMPRMPSFSPDASMMAFVNEVNGLDQIFVKHNGQGAAVQLTFDNVPSRRPRWSPRNDEILYSRGEQTASSGPAFGVDGIWSVPPLGGVPHVVAQNGRNPNWSRDGSLIVFERGDEVFVAQADGKNPYRVNGIPRGAMLLANRTPAFSPDSTQIAFFHPESGPQGDLWLVPVHGGQPRRLTFDVDDGGSPVWTPDGRSIVFVSQRSGVEDLWTVPASGGKPELVFGATGENSDPDVSADGRRLIFSNTRHQYVLAIVNPTTGRVRQLLERRLAISYPMFSPRGDKLSFFSMEGEPGINHICTIDVDGTHLNQITRDNSERNTFPHWSPDGAFLYHYRSLPDRSYRKTRLSGGPPSVEVAPAWAWETHYGARVDPSDRSIVYTATRAGTPFRTWVRNIKTGVEHPLAKALDDPRWSADGRFVFGTDRLGQPPPQGDISVCPADGTVCRQVTHGYLPVPSADNRSIYFLRASGSADSAELWTASLAGEGEQKVAELRPMRSIAHFYDVSPQGEIVYVQLKPGTRDLWLSERR